MNGAKKLVPGFSRPGESSYPTRKPEYQSVEKRWMTPNPGTRPHFDKIYEFSHKIPNLETWRLLPEACLLEVSLYIKNALTLRLEPLDPLKGGDVGSHNAFLHPNLTGSALFKGVDLYFNNQRLENAEKVGNQRAIWQNTNRNYITDRDHELRYGRKRTTIPNTDKLTVDRFTNDYIREGLANLPKKQSFVEKVDKSDLADSYISGADRQDDSARGNAREAQAEDDDDDETPAKAAKTTVDVSQPEQAPPPPSTDDATGKQRSGRATADMSSFHAMGRDKFIVGKENPPDWGNNKTARITYDSRNELMRETVNFVNNMLGKPKLKKELEDACLPYRMTSREDVVLVPFSFDETFPFSMQSNVTRNLTGIEKENPFLPPGTEFTVRMERADDMSVFLERFNLYDTTEFFKGNPNQFFPDLDDVQIIVRNVYIGFEVLKLPYPSTFPVPADGILKYRPDIVKCQEFTLEPNSRTMKKKMMVPPETAAIVAVFTTAEFVSPSYPKKRHATSFTPIPEGLEEMVLTHYTSNGPVEHRKLKDLGKGNAYSTKENQEYHRELLRLNMTDVPLHEWLPHEHNNLALGFSYMADTINDQEKQYSDAIMDLTFERPGQATNWKLTVFFVTQGLITCNTKTGIWKVE